MKNKLTVLLLFCCLAVVSALVDYKRARHNAWVSRRCRRVQHPACCPRAGPCRIRYYMYYYRLTRLDSCASPTACWGPCYKHYIECRQNCAAAMTYAERRYGSDTCKCKVSASLLTATRNLCYGKCSLAYTQCRENCNRPGTCPITARTRVWFVRELGGDCAQICPRSCRLQAAESRIPKPASVCNIFGAAPLARSPDDATEPSSDDEKFSTAEEN